MHSTQNPFHSEGKRTKIVGICFGQFRGGKDLLWEKEGILFGRLSFQVNKEEKWRLRRVRKPFSTTMNRNLHFILLPSFPLFAWFFAESQASWTGWLAQEKLNLSNRTHYKYYNLNQFTLLSVSPLQINEQNKYRSLFTHKLKVEGESIF